MIEIEFEPAHESEPCECCGYPTTSLTRFRLVVSAEDIPQVDRPNLPYLLTTDVFEVERRNVSPGRPPRS